MTSNQTPAPAPAPAVPMKITAAKRELASRILSKRNLLPFIQRMNPKYTAGWVHEDICRRLEQFSKDVDAGLSPRLMLLMPPRHGKACRVGTAVPTPSGFRAIETLKVGDYVFGRDGKPTRVVAVSEIWRDRPLYEVVSDDGASVIVDAEHEWTVRLCRKHQKYKPKTTQSLFERTSPRKPALMTYSAAEYPQAVLPISPYVLGAWLGDGCSQHASMTQGEQDFAFMRAEIEREGVTTSERSTEGTFGLLGLQKPLRLLGLLNNKHIPEQYLNASIAQRRALLQGLVDTDGHVAPDGQIEFCSVNEELARHTLTLVRSLGVKASLVQGDATLNGAFISRKYRVMFYMAGAARLPRKAERCRDGVRSPHRFLTFKPAGHGDTVCIQVEAEDHQYLVGHGYMLTHNSEIASKTFPAWHLGNFPDHEIIACSYNISLAMGFSKKIKALFDDPAYQSVFDARLHPDNRSTEEWSIHNHSGGYVAAGVGGGITGKGAHILIIDDPIKNAEEADSATTRESLWDWYGSTAYTRLAPGAGVLVIQCMTGDTPVRMADGVEQRLDSLAAGDAIATYDKGVLSTSTVSAVKSNGHDSVFKITTRCGKVVRANDRHPFLVALNGELKWIRTKNLTTAHRIVTLKGNEGSGQALYAQLKDAQSQLAVGDSALRTTIRKNGQTGTAPQASIQLHGATPTSNTATASPVPNSTLYSKVKKAYALFARSLLALTNHITGKINSPSTTATTQVKSEGYSVTTATRGSDILELSQWHLPLPDTSDFTLSEIVSIELDGVEEVFDLQVERTENFIANGVVSHNTWWHDDDLAGRLQQAMASDPESDQFEIIKYPAIAEHDEYLDLDTDAIVHDVAPANGKLLRLKGDPLHEARYDIKKLKRIKATIANRFWAALYQQNPVPDDGAYFVKEHFKRGPLPMRKTSNVSIAWDFAISEKQHNDYTVGSVGLQDFDDVLHIAEMVRFKSGDAFVIVDAILNTAKRWYHPSLTIGVEDGQIYRSIEALLKKRMREMNFYPPIVVLRPITDKQARGRALQGRMQQGMVSFNHEGEWYDVARNEMLRFPAGVHDDCVDSLAWLAQLAVGKEPPQRAKEAKVKSWRDKLRGGSSNTSHMAA